MCMHLQEWGIFLEKKNYEKKEEVKTVAGEFFFSLYIYNTGITRAEKKRGKKTEKEGNKLAAKVCGEYRGVKRVRSKKLCKVFE